MDYLRAGSVRWPNISIPIKPTLPFRDLFFAGALLCLSAAPSMAANYALLIGAADYQNPNINKLKGPPNDVTLMWRLLTEKRGFDPQNITVLADGLADKAGEPRFPRLDGAPKHDAILKAFSLLAEQAKSGDLVMIFYSGHGTQQPVKDANKDPERDNLDQVMLPTDAGDYDPKTKTVLNGIVNDEIGAALDKIRDKNADVWVMIDACHAGSMTRGLVDGTGTAVRGVEPARLGIPPATPRPAATARSPAPESWSFPSKSARGSLVGFFAVDSSREAIERAYEEFDAPMIGKGADLRAGVFTYFLYRALSDGKHKVSRYQDLARLIVAEMRKSENPPSAMPTFDGDLNRPFLAGGIAPPNPVWQVEVDGDKVVVPAGTLHGLAANTVLKLSASPDGPEWAKATVTKAEAIRSVALLEKPAAGERPATVWASIAQPSVSFRLTVAEPPAEELADPAARKFIEDVKAAANVGAIEWVSPQAAAQLRLRVYEGKVWILPADGEWIRKDLQERDPRLKIYSLTPSVSIRAESAEISVRELARKLYSRARADNLVRVAQSWNEALADQGASKNIRVTAERLVQGGSNNDPHRECPDSPQNYKVVSSFEEKSVPPIFHCDVIKVTIKNTGPHDLDMNVSYVDAGGGITTLNARKGDHCTFTLPAGAGEAVRYAMVRTWQGGKGGSPDTVGREHIVVTAIEQKDGIESDLCFNQETVRSVGEPQRGPTRGTAGSLLKTLRDASLAPAATRGGGAVIEKESDDAPEASAAVFSFEVTPARIQ
jgi:hypothetical protein